MRIKKRTKNILALIVIVVLIGFFARQFLALSLISPLFEKDLEFDLQENQQWFVYIAKTSNPLNGFKLETATSGFEFDFDRPTRGQSCNPETYNVRISKDNTLIDTVPIPTACQGDNAVRKAYGDDGIIYTGELPEGKSGINVVLNNRELNVGDGSVEVLNNVEIVYPLDYIEVEFDVPEVLEVEGTNLSINATVKSNYDSLEGDFIVKFTIPSFLGEISRTDKIPLSIQRGQEKTFEFVFNAEESTRELKIEAWVRPKKSLSGFEEDPNPGRLYTIDYDTEEPIFTDFPDPFMGEVTGLERVVGFGNLTDSFVIDNQFASTEKTIQIVPKPLFLPLEGNSCPEGYEISRDQTYCVRDDISQLSCFQTGCPTINNVPYTCTSSGFCAETIFIPGECTSDLMCSNLTGGQATKCDIETGTCFNERIYNNFVQCDLPTDCITPCPGVTATCTENRCAYSGTCDSIELDCRAFSCNEGFSCEQQDSGFYGCVEESKISPSVILLGIGFILLIGIAVFFFKKRRK